MNENAAIGVALAVELGHERVYPVDDHTGDHGSGPVDEEVYADEITDIWDNEWSEARRATYESWQQRITTDPSASILDWYRAIVVRNSVRTAPDTGYSPRNSISRSASSRSLPMDRAARSSSICWGAPALVPRMNPRFVQYCESSWSYVAAC
jgi:hypothetical protein